MRYAIVAYMDTEAPLSRDQAESHRMAVKTIIEDQEAAKVSSVSIIEEPV